MSLKEQKIPFGPVAPMVAVKQLGTNGGGWYGPNSAMTLENPTPFSNLLEMLAILLIPVALTFMVGTFVRRRRFTALIFGTMLLMSVVSTGLAMWSEAHSSSTPTRPDGRQGSADRRRRLRTLGCAHHTDQQRFGQRHARLAGAADRRCR